MIVRLCIAVQAVLDNIVSDILAYYRLH